MRMHDGERYEDWLERIRKFEYGYALQQIAKGQDVNVVMEAMAARMMQKMLHPLIMKIKDSVPKSVVYETTSTQGNIPTGVADHIDGQIFDKDR